ncbi:thaumatin-like protein [Ceratobasidium sp. AG-I]|nr:thaumatin-like protein [Ceratobasidium sp. AG-I]
MFSNIVVLVAVTQLVAARTFTVTNACPFTIWPAVYTNLTMGSAVPLVETGWEAMPQTSKTFYVPDNWAAGRIWGRRSCNFWNVQGQTSCLTGGCDGGLNCTQPGAPPSTLAEWTLSPTADRFDYYDVSLVDGYDLPMRISTNKDCPVAECPVDLIDGCPDALKGPYDSSGYASGCQTSCFANVDGNPYNSTNCCSGAFSAPDRCPSSGVAYYDYFKGRCPNSWAYTFDEPSGNALKTCSGQHQADYTLTFCP